MGACDIRWPGPSAVDALSRHGRADGEDRIGGEDLFGHRLEDRLDVRGAAGGEAVGTSAPVSDLHQPAQSAMGRGGGAGQAGCLVCGHAGGLSGVARSAGRGVAAGGL